MRENMTQEKNLSMRRKIEERRRAEVARELAEAGDPEAIRETFGRDFRVVAKNPQHMQEVIRRVDERLEGPEDSVYGLYKEVAEEFIDEITSKRKTDEQLASETIAEMAAERERVTGHTANE